MGPFGPTDKKNQVKYKKYRFRYITFLNGKDPDPYHIENQDLDPQHSFLGISIYPHYLSYKSLPCCLQDLIATIPLFYLFIQEQIFTFDNDGWSR